MINNKKGMGGQEALLIVILAVVVLLVFWPISKSFASLLKKDAEIEECRLSVLSHSSSIGKKAVPLKCPRREVILSEKKIKINNEVETKYSFKKLDDETVNKLVAEELRKCWYKMGEGKINVFNNNLLAGNKRVCILCASIKFDSSVTQSRFTGIEEYLNNKIPKSDITYSDYLIREQSKFFLGGVALPFAKYYTKTGTQSTSRVDPETVLDKDKEYFIYFLGIQPSELAEETQAIDPLYFIGLGSATEIYEQCEVLAN